MTTFAPYLAPRPQTLRPSTAAELMTPDVLSFETSMPIQKARALLELYQLEAAPLVDDAGKLAGVVTASACAAWEEFSLRSSAQLFAEKRIDWTPVAEIANPVVPSLRSNTPTSEVIRQLLQQRARRLYVVDATDKLVGVVSMSDVLNFLSNSGDLPLRQAARFC